MNDAERKILFTEVKARLVLHKDGYKIEDILDPHLNYIIFKKDIRKRILYRSILKKFLVIPHFRRLSSVQTSVLFSFPEWTSRRDYHEILNFVSAEVANKTIYPLSKLGLKPSFNLGYLKLAFKKTRNIPGLDLRSRVYITAVLYNVLMMIGDAEKNIHVQIDKYVSFSCLVGIEHLLTQYFKKRNIPTYNLQHGVTFLHTINHIDEMEYRNIISDHHLAWGDYTRDELLRYGMHPERVITAGYPRKIVINDMIPPDGNNCLVLLSRADFKEVNFKLLELLHTFNESRQNKFRFYLKLHPSLNKSALQKIISQKYPRSGFYFADLRQSLHELLKQGTIDFGIVVNSTAYYECYIHGIAALRFKDPSFDMSYGIAEDSFEKPEELNNLCNQLYDNFGVLFNTQIIAERLDYVVGLNKNEYGRLL